MQFGFDCLGREFGKVLVKGFQIASSYDIHITVINENDLAIAAELANHLYATVRLGFGVQSGVKPTYRDGVRLVSDLFNE